MFQRRINQFPGTAVHIRQHQPVVFRIHRSLLQGLRVCFRGALRLFKGFPEFIHFPLGPVDGLAVLLIVPGIFFDLFIQAGFRVRKLFRDLLLLRRGLVIVFRSLRAVFHGRIIGFLRRKGPHHLIDRFRCLAQAVVQFIIAKPQVWDFFI